MGRIFEKFTPLRHPTIIGLITLAICSACFSIPALAWQVAGDLKASKNAASDEVLENAPMLEDLLLFYPSKHPEGNWKPENLEFEDVWITTPDKVKIHAWYCPAKKPRAIVLFAHGNAGNLSDRAELVSYFQNKLNITTLIFDYRGYGRSEGTPSTKGALVDARAAADYLAKREKVKAEKLVFLGRSLGGAILVQLAGDLQPRGLIIESSFSSLKAVAKRHYPKLAWVVSRNKLDSKTAIGKYDGSLLQSHGDWDQVVPIALGRELYEAANQPKQFVTIANGGHNDAPPKSYYETLASFLDKLPK